MAENAWSRFWFGLTEWVFDNLLIPLLALMLAVLVGLSAWALYSRLTEDEKSPWRCDTQVQEGTTTVIVPVGKVMVPQQRPRYKCILWSAPAEGGGTLVSNGQKTIRISPDLTVED